VLKKKQSGNLDQFLAGVEGRAFVIARIATRDAEAALDLVQDAMFKLAKKYGDRDESEWAPLFHRILQHCIRDRQRRTWVRNKWRAWFPANRDDETSEDKDPIEAIPDRSARSPLDQLADKGTNAALEIALHHLPLRQRQAFLLRAWEGYNVAETAGIMGCTAGSVKTHYSRAVRALRIKMKEFK